MTDRIYLALGELRACHLVLFEPDAGPFDVLLSAPGAIEQPAADATRAWARRPSKRLSASSRHEFSAHLLESFTADIDRLPQEEEWALYIQQWLEALGARQIRVWLRRDHASQTRLISHPDESVMTAGPIVPETWHADEAHPAELRMALTGAAHRHARHWFEEARAQADDITEQIADILRASWAGDAIDPEDFYYRVTAGYFAAALEGLDAEADDNPMRRDLTTFQERAYDFAKSILRRYGGVILADVVGLGKTYIAMALLRYLQDTSGSHAVVVAPPAICKAWNDLAEQYEMRRYLKTVSIGKLEDLQQYREYEVLVVDESHNFRNANTRRYEMLAEWVRPDSAAAERKVLLLSATPQNTSPDDLLAQLKLFPDVYTPLPYRAESLEHFFQRVSAGVADPTSLLQHVVVRRTRGFIRANYPDAVLHRRTADGRRVRVPLTFPERICGPEQCLRYRIDESYTGDLYGEILGVLATMKYPLHGLGDYVRPESRDEKALTGLRRSGRGLRGLYKVLLLKRLESSMHAFRLTSGRLIDRLDEALDRLDDGWIRIRLAEPRDSADEGAGLSDERDMPSRHFETERLRADLVRDRQHIEGLLDRIADLDENLDAKFQRLRRWLADRPPTAHRTIVFTQFADTAAWLADNLGAEFGQTEMVSGSTGGTIQRIQRFAPKANRVEIPRAEQIDLLVSTDALSEGVNLQDADTLINYDIHWNPVRLIQRAGRIDRIGSENEEIIVASFLPELGLEQALGLEQVVRARIADFRRVFGEDGVLLPDDERPEEDTIVSAYSGEALEAADLRDDLDGLSRHVERVTRLRDEDPERYDRVCAIRPGVRACSKAQTPPVAVTRLSWLWHFWTRSEASATILDDVDGLEALWRHAESGEGEATDVAAPRALGRLAMEAFHDKAQTFRETRQRPRLTKAEDWVRERLEIYGRDCTDARRPLVEQMRDWVLAGQHKSIFLPVARRWRSEELRPEATFQEMKSVVRRFPIRREALGEETLVGVVDGAW